MLLGVATINFFTLLIPLVRSGEQLIIVRLLTGLAGDFAASAPFPIAAELMPAQHRRTYGAIYEMMLASSFTLVPLVGLVVAGSPNGFRLMALPALLGLFVAPVLVYLLIPESPRWYLRRGNPAAAVDVVNRIIERCGSRPGTLSLPRRIRPKWRSKIHDIEVMALINDHLEIIGTCGCRASVEVQRSAVLVASFVASSCGGFVSQNEPDRALS
jgi:MFS family permease